MSLRRQLIHGTLLMAMVGSGAVASAEELSEYSGRQLYTRFCASCHGEDGKGDGPVAPFFKLSPPDLTRIAQRHRGDFPAEKIASIIDGRTQTLPHGSRQMPVWGVEFLAAEGTSDEGRARAQAIVDRLVEYLRSIQAN